MRNAAYNAPDSARRASREESKLISQKLSESRIFKDYEAAFADATGLPLAIKPLDAFHVTMRGKKQENPFCALMSQTNKSCAACLNMQADLESKAALGAKSLRCFAGFCDSMIPIRVGDKLIAFLQTGQILLHKPHANEFSKTAQQLLAWGSQVDLRTLEEAYFQSSVLDPTQYEAFLRMLQTFAEHLGTISNSLAIEEGAEMPELIKSVKRYVDKNYDRPLSLKDASKSVNASVRHFCATFKKATGITFVDYLTRLRVEKAKNLLSNPNRRVTEIAFEVGFESIAQFNRSFKRITGRTPTAYRKSASA